MASVTFTLPLKITIELPEGAISELESAVTPAAALEALESEREYYDEATDLVARDSYYSAISLDASPTDLYRQLNRLVKSTHKKKLKYAPSTHVYPWVDLQEDGSIASIYSGETFSPLELIERDAAAERARLDGLETALSLESFSTSDIPALMDQLEANFPFNCEHVVPQSWFAKKEPMRGDLHHLFACEVKCNSFRSNFPFTQFELEKVMQDCGEAIDGKFEPLGGKGAVSRATLYFLLRYPGEINNRENDYTRQALATLKDWANQHPVTLYEQHRNMAIQEKQGNRNPLIDFPELVDRIDFNLGLGR
jgi:endonuclease I